jgi:hypothetical protein
MPILNIWSKGKEESFLIPPSPQIHLLDTYTRKFNLLNRKNKIIFLNKSVTFKINTVGCSSYKKTPTFRIPDFEWYR